MKFLEEQFQNLAFGTLADLTTARYNKLHAWLDTVEDDKLLESYGQRNETRKQNNETGAIQEVFRLEAARRLLDQVRSNFIL